MHAYLQLMRQLTCRFEMSPEKMIELVLTGEEYEFSQELCEAFWNGFPVENLRPLLASPSLRVQALGSYLVYELGGKARPLLDDIVSNLEHSDAQIRADAINCLADCVTKFDTDLAGRLVLMLADEDPFVQRIAMKFVQYCDRSVLNAGVLNAAKTASDTVFKEFPRCIGERPIGAWSALPVCVNSLARLTHHESPIARRFGVALAARPRLIVDETFLDIAAVVADDGCDVFIEAARQFGPFRGRELMRIPVV